MIISFLTPVICLLDVFRELRIFLYFLFQTTKLMVFSCCYISSKCCACQNKKSCYNDSSVYRL